MTGPGGAGKTSTVRSLKGEAFIKEHISTIGADASATCTVTRNNVGVDWKKREVESTFAEHAATKIKQEMASLISSSSPSKATTSLLSTMNDDNERNESNKPRRPSLMQRFKNSFTSKSSASASSSSVAIEDITNATSASSTTNTKSEVKKIEEVVEKSKNISMKDDQDAVNVHTMELVAKAVDDKDKILKNEENIALSIWDLGGQEVFYTLHHLFLTEYAVYLCIFDMRHMISDDKQVREKSLNYTNFWLRSIQMHANGAPIFLIGTFKDIVNKDHQHDTIDEILCEYFDFGDIVPTLVKSTKQKLVF